MKEVLHAKVYLKLGLQEQQYALMIANLAPLIYRVTLHALLRRSGVKTSKISSLAQTMI